MNSPRRFQFKTLSFTSKSKSGTDNLLDSEDENSEHQYDVSLQNYLDAKNKKEPLFMSMNQKEDNKCHLRDIDEYLEFYENLQKNEETSSQKTIKVGT